MIEVTCGACGSTARFAEADVPPGGKAVTCAQCKARINIPGRSGPPRPAMPAIPTPMSAPKQGGAKGDVIDLGDLPAPKRPSPLAGALPPPTTPGRKPASPPPPPTSAVGDLEMDLIDLPAPVGPEPSGGGLDLPAPKRAATNNPAVRQGALEPRGFEDLPAPKRAAGPAAGPAPDLDIVDLPGPKLDLADLPAPKGQHPSSASSGLDLPAPKGFFDDLPAPKGASAPAGPGASIGFDDLPAPKGQHPSAASGGVDLPAPKGFFDDLPAPKGAHPSAGSTDLPAPKGFFDDLPAPLSAQPSGKADLPAPKGFFDDLPGPPSRKGGTVPPSFDAGTQSGKPKSLDLDDLDLAPPTQPPTTSSSRAAMANAGTAAPRAMPLELPNSPDVPPLELDGPGDRFGGLELPAVAPAGTAPAKAAAAAAAAAAPSSGGVSFKPGDGAGNAVSLPAPRGDDMLDLDVEGGKKPAPASSGRATPIPTKKGSAAKDKDAPKRALSPKAKKIAAAAMLVVVLLGAGGFWFYQRMEAEKAQKAKISASLRAARAQLASGEPGHWARAANAAQDVLRVVKSHPEALGLAAEATLAALYDDGVQPQQRRAAAETLIEQMRTVAARGTHVDRASALWSLASNDPDGAIAALMALASAAPNDADVQLYLGWAHAARNDWAAAKTAYTAAAKAPNRDMAASYGLGLAHLALGELDAARTSFGHVNELAKNKPHYGAQIGVAAAMPAAEYARRETELIGILERKDADAGDPRALAMGWRIAGDDARRAGRLDVARSRYREALKRVDTDVPSIVGDAELDITEQRFETAEASLKRALELAPGDRAAQLARAALDLERGRVAEAEAALAPLLKDPPANAADRGRAYLLHARALESTGSLAEASAAYEQAQTALGNSDIGPTIARAAILGRMADAAQKAGKADEASQLRTTRSALLAGLEAEANKDPATALTLARAYLGADDGASAERWLRAALAARPSDVEIRVQLGAALELQGKNDAAIAVLLEALDLDPSRDGVGTRLAETLEAAGRIDEAATLWAKLLANPKVTIDLRIRAGMFYVRHGDAAAAATQGDLVLTAEPRNAAGLYLKGEGLYAKLKYDEARDVFKAASDVDRQAIYLDGYARASEMLAYADGDAKYDDDALRGYTQAAELDPKMMSSHVGRARVHLKRREYDKAIAAYDAARALGAEHPDISYGLGMAYAGKKDVAKATEWLLRSVKQRPRADAHLALANIYLDDANLRAAKAQYAAAIKLAREDERAGKTVKWMEETLWQLGDLHKSDDEDRQACPLLREWISRSPTNVAKVESVKTYLATRCR